MQFEDQAVLLTAKSEPYDFNGNTGVSHKIRLMMNGEIFEVRSSAEQVASLKQYEKQSGTAKFTLSSPKEKLKLSLDSFEVEK